MTVLAWLGNWLYRYLGLPIFVKGAVWMASYVVTVVVYVSITGHFSATVPILVAAPFLVAIPMVPRRGDRN